jgi:hypothetical protein
VHHPVGLTELPERVQEVLYEKVSKSKLETFLAIKVTTRILQYYW